MNSNGPSRKQAGILIFSFLFLIFLGGFSIGHGCFILGATFSFIPIAAYSLVIIFWNKLDS